ncbi:MAG TPA: methyltransferase domain-containing protein [Myxococcota bacterium]|nr:methyltransferase domain-containing protein [Myxococcota bacterium]
MPCGSGPALEPEVDVACDACGEVAADEVCSSENLAAQAELARRFHRARLARRSRAALDERARFTHDYATRLLACRRCELLYRSPRPAADAVLRAYEGERYPAERIPQMVASQRALFRPKARALARSLGTGARVLEVGSFVGGFLREARDSGLDAVGLDPSEQLGTLCLRAGLRVVRATLEEVAEKREFPHFDAIAIWNTFDQLPRPRRTLRAALHMLRPGGLLLLRFPHGACFRRLLARKPLPLRALAWNNLLGFPYLHGYGLRSLDSLLGDFAFARSAVAGDTLGTLADASYTHWTRLEERAVKSAQRRHWQRENDLSLAPWLDVELRAEPLRDGVSPSRPRALEP